MALEKEDYLNETKGKPYRYAVLLDCDINLIEDGLFEIIDNKKLGE